MEITECFCSHQPFLSSTLSTLNCWKCLIYKIITAPLYRACMKSLIFSHTFFHLNLSLTPGPPHTISTFTTFSNSFPNSFLCCLSSFPEQQQFFHSYANHLLCLQSLQLDLSVAHLQKLSDNKPQARREAVLSRSTRRIPSCFAVSLLSAPVTCQLGYFWTQVQRPFKSYLQN